MAIKDNKSKYGTRRGLLPGQNIWTGEPRHGSGRGIYTKNWRARSGLAWPKTSSMKTAAINFWGGVPRGVKQVFNIATTVLGPGGKVKAVDQARKFFMGGRSGANLIKPLAHPKTAKINLQGGKGQSGLAHPKTAKINLLGGKSQKRQGIEGMIDESLEIK